MLVAIAFSKSDFSYGFINNDGKQMDFKTKKQLKDGFIILENIKNTMNEGDVKEAYKQIIDFSKLNKISIFKSDIALLQSEILMKLEGKRFVLEAERFLEGAINSGQIREESLLDAYMLLVKIKLKANKAKEALYFAQTILENYDTPLKQVYGKIALAEISLFQRDLKKAKRILNDVLYQTSDIDAASIVADKLFDLYMEEKKPEKAYELMEKILKSNPNFFLKDIPYAISKAKQLQKSSMPELAINLFEKILKKTKSPQTIEKVKMMLADAYLDVAKLDQAKEYYKQIMSEYPDSPSEKKAKTAIDEILMREGKFTPRTIAEKYPESNHMQQTALFQELLTKKKEKKYGEILKSKKVYNKLSDAIANRFGYKNVKDIYRDVQIAFIKDYLDANKCEELDKTMNEIELDALNQIISDPKYKNKFFECLVDYPNKKVFKVVNEALKDSRNAEAYLSLAKMAFNLMLYDDSLEYSKMVEMTQDEAILRKEFLQKFLLAKTIDDKKMVEDLLKKAENEPVFIEANKNEPMMLDFYYDYYFYLVAQNKIAKANEILKKMDQIKKAKRIKIYSPFVEINLADLEKNNKKYNAQIALLERALKNSWRISQNEYARIYYELSKSFKAMGKITQSDEYLDKCKKTTDKLSMWKKMCERAN